MSCHGTDDATRARLLELPELERHGADVLRHPPAGWEDSLELLELVPAAAKPWPIARECSRQFTAVRNSGSRRLSAIRLLVVHSTEGDTAGGAASWFANRASQGSAHVVADGVNCYRTLPPSRIAWGAPGVNGDGWHLELAGFAHWSRREWLRHAMTLNRGAYKLAQHSLAFGIPLRFLTDAELRRGARGVISHREASRVYGGTHSDPGADFPWDYFLGRARGYRKELGL